jgi:hypothetical protein
MFFFKTRYNNWRKNKCINYEFTAIASTDIVSFDPRQSFAAQHEVIIKVSRIDETCNIFLFSLNEIFEFSRALK